MLHMKHVFHNLCLYILTCITCINIYTHTLSVLFKLDKYFTNESNDVVCRCCNFTLIDIILNKLSTYLNVAAFEMSVADDDVA